MLALPKSGCELAIDTDASDGQIDVALYQTENDDVSRPIGFWSRTLNPAESNYFMPEKECLALVWGIKILRPYLLGNPFKAYTDDEALRWLMTIDDPSGQLMRWLLRLSEFDFTPCSKK